MESERVAKYLFQAMTLLTLWGVAKVPHFNRQVLADLLGHPEHLIHFVELEVGGGFGVRGEFYPEDLLVPWAARRLGRPVQWIEDRREHFMATNHSRQQAHDIEIGFDADGRIVALLDRFVVDLDIRLSDARSADTDALALTVEYGTLAAAVAEIVGGEPVRLLERLASLIADRVLAEPRARYVEVTVRKPHVALPQVVTETAVTLTRHA